MTQKQIEPYLKNLRPEEKDRVFSHMNTCPTDPEQIQTGRLPERRISSFHLLDSICTPAGLITHICLIEYDAGTYHDFRLLEATTEEFNDFLLFAAADGASLVLKTAGTIYLSGRPESF